jgi:endonuclease/exonuclease/phosphatase family metal-dependent hydrolase
MKVKIINLNMFYGGKVDWDNAVQYLQEEQPDIVLLQEVYWDAASGRSQFTNTVPNLQAVLDYKYAEGQIEFVFETRDGVVGPIGNAIMSRFSLENKKIVWLTGSGPGELTKQSDREALSHLPRALVHCEVSIEGKVYNIMTLHGVFSEKSEENDLQRAMGKQIVEYIQGMPNVILGGDFNVREDSDAIRMIEDHLENVFKGERTTSFDSRHENLRAKVANEGFVPGPPIDHIFVSPDIKVVEHRTAEACVSDHQSQIVVLDL